MHGSLIIRWRNISQGHHGAWAALLPDAHPDASMTLDFIQTLAFAGVVLFVGYGIKRAVPLLARYNLPAPVIGGLLVARADHRDQRGRTGRRSPSTRRCRRR